MTSSSVKASAHSGVNAMNHFPDLTGYSEQNLWFEIALRDEFPTLVKGKNEESRALRVLTKEDLRRHHGLLFSKVAVDVPRLFGVMREVDAILGGSALLHMLCPLFADVPNYDFFVPLDGVDILTSYLITEEGYEMDALQARAGSNGCMVDDVRYLSGISRRVTLTRGDMVVNVMGVGVADAWDRAEGAIATAWTTLLMNYTTADFIEVAYPTLTLMGRGLVQWDRVLHPTFPGGTPLPELKKYTTRGYEFRTHADDWDVGRDGEMRPCGSSWVCPLRPRAFGDAGCMWVAMRDGVRREVTTSWTFGGTPCPLVCDRAERRKNEIHMEWCACGRGQ